MAAPGVSIIIVNYNGGALLAECLRSIAQHVRVEHEVIVVDNASTDDSLTQAAAGATTPAGEPQVRFVRNAENVGFAVANNAGASHARGQFLHFLNPDTQVGPCLDDAYRAILDEGASNRVYTTALANAAGVRAKSRFLLPTVANYVWALRDARRCTWWWLGASVIVPRALFVQLGGWPDDYFMYAEDLDLFYTIALAGAPVEQLDCAVTHAEKGSTQLVWSATERAVRVERSTRRFYARHGLLLDYYLLAPVVMLRQWMVSPANGWQKTQAFLRVLWGG